MHITLERSATVREAGAIAARLAEGVAAADSVLTINADAVADADLSLIQLIEATRRATAAAGGRTCLTAPANAAIAAVLDRAGFLTDPAAADLDFWFHGGRPQ